MNAQNFNVNISIDEVIAQQIAEKEKAVQTAKKTTTKFDTKNYLQAKLGKNETTKTLVIRLLPFKPGMGTPFQKVYMHQVRVNKAISESGWKTFPCPTHNHLGEKCPFCETSKLAKDLKYSAASEPEKKKYGDIEYANKVKEQWVVRCIERGHEEDGVKFWLFSHSKKGDGVYDKIMNIVQTRYTASKLVGREDNILDINNGKDLVITLSKDSQGKTVINVIDDSINTPLSTNVEQARAWINDTKEWQEVYTVKPYEYMAIVVQGGVPQWSKEQNCYVDKTLADAENKATEEAEVKTTVTPVTKDLSVPPTAATGGIFLNDDDEPF